MNVASIVTSVASGVVSPLANIWTKSIERKQAKESLKAKVAIARDEQAATQELTDSEWELLKVQQEGGSLKDEYITLVITSPIPLIVVGAMVAAVTENPELLNGAILGINSLTEAGVPMGNLMTATVLAGLGLKAWRQS